MKILKALMFLLLVSSINTSSVIAMKRKRTDESDNTTEISRKKQNVSIEDLTESINQLSLLANTHNEIFCMIIMFGRPHEFIGLRGASKDLKAKIEHFISNKNWEYFQWLGTRKPRIANSAKFKPLVESDMYSVKIKNIKCLCLLATHHNLSDENLLKTVEDVVLKYFDPYGRPNKYDQADSNEKAQLEKLIEFLIKMMDATGCIDDPYEKKSECETTTLCMSLHFHYDHITKMLLEHGADPNQPEIDHDEGGVTYPIELAFMSKNINMIKLLVEKGADCYRAHHLLDFALDFKSQETENEMIELALKHGFRRKKSCIAEILIKKGNINGAKMIINQKNFDPLQGTPLIAAVQIGSIELVKLLLDCGADVNACDEECSPLFHALFAKKINLEIIKLLLESGANPHPQAFGASILAFAMNLDHEKQAKLDLVKIILKYTGPNAIIDKAGNVPLSYAVHHQDINLTKYLLDNGANPVYKNEKTGETILDTALKFQNETITDLICNAIFKQVLQSDNKDK